MTKIEPAAGLAERIVDAIAKGRERWLTVGDTTVWSRHAST